MISNENDLINFYEKGIEYTFLSDVQVGVMINEINEKLENVSDIVKNLFPWGFVFDSSSRVGCWRIYLFYVAFVREDCNVLLAESFSSVMTAWLTGFDIVDRTVSFVNVEKVDGMVGDVLSDVMGLELSVHGFIVTFISRVLNVYLNDFREFEFKCFKVHVRVDDAVKHYFDFCRNNFGCNVNDVLVYYFSDERWLDLDLVGGSTPVSFGLTFEDYLLFCGVDGDTMKEKLYNVLFK